MMTRTAGRLERSNDRSKTGAGRGSAHQDIAIAFLRAAVSGQVREAWDAHVAPGFKHHNPWFPGDAASLMQGMEANAREHPHKKLDIKRALEDGALVAVHSHVILEPGQEGHALMHIFRFTGDKIVELWDIAQEVPAKSPNEYGMF